MSNRKKVSINPNENLVMTGMTGLLRVSMDDQENKELGTAKVDLRLGKVETPDTMHLTRRSNEEEIKMSNRKKVLTSPNENLVSAGKNS